MYDLWGQFASHPEVFTRRLLGVYYSSDPDQLGEYLTGTEIRRRHTESLIETFERLLDAGSRCDPDGILRSALHGSAHGILYRLACEDLGRAPAGAPPVADASPEVTPGTL